MRQELDRAQSDIDMHAFLSTSAIAIANGDTDHTHLRIRSRPEQLARRR